MRGTREARTNGYSVYSIAIGKHHSYLSTIAASRSLRYRYMMVLGKGDLIQGHMNYERYSDHLKIELQDIYFKGSDIKFYNFLVDNGFFTTRNSALRFTDDNIFSTEKVLSVTTMKKARAILKKHKEIKEN